jgi:hypothetical protein
MCDERLVKWALAQLPRDTGHQPRGDDVDQIVARRRDHRRYQRGQVEALERHHPGI